MTFRPYPGFTLFAAVMIAILCGLGFWQLQRLNWKENLIAFLNHNMHVRPVVLDGTGFMMPEIYTQYVRVTAHGHFENAKEVYLFTTAPGGGAIYHILTPFVVAHGTYLVDRGAVPAERLDPRTRRAGLIEGETTVSGFWHWPEAPSMFTPKPDLARHVWYTRAVEEIAAYEHIRLAEPALVDADAAPVPGGWPKGGQTVVDLPNNHLQYAITWFGLAAVMAGIWAAYHISKGRIGLN